MGMQNAGSGGGGDDDDDDAGGGGSSSELFCFIYFFPCSTLPAASSFTQMRMGG
jgi:hypothetical protein